MTFYRHLWSFNIKTFLRVTLISLLSFTLLSAKGSQDALKYLNEIRQHTGLVKFKSNKKLDRAAKSHANYLVRQQKHGHYEKKGRAGYTGKTPSNRVLKAGYSSRVVMENVTENAKNYRHSIDILMAAVYHRFVFLNFENNEIGIGTASTKKKSKIKSAFVYNTGSSEIVKLCKQFHLMENNSYYLQNMCKDPDKMIAQDLYVQKQNEMRRKNKNIVLYPYPNAQNVLPVFYTENPHPLPGSKVSGYPVTVQFNPLLYEKIRLKKFRLFDEKGKRIKKVKILTHKSDKHHRLSKLQFALMPLKRLEYGTRYSVEFEVVADGKKVKKSWHFTTKNPKGKLYKITKNKTTLKVPRGEQIALYFEPRSNKDVLDCISYTHKLHISCEDQNTLLLTIPRNEFLTQEYIVETDERSVSIGIE